MSEYEFQRAYMHTLNRWSMQTLPVCIIAAVIVAIYLSWIAAAFIAALGLGMFGWGWASERAWNASQPTEEEV